LGRYGITFTPVLSQKESDVPSFMVQRPYKKISNHTSLAVIDRMVRTLRDMAYYKKVREITPPVMNKLLRYYNSAPHRGLSKIMGFDVKPLDVENDNELEQEIIRRLIAINHEIKDRNGFVLPVGATVEVYNANTVMDKRRSAVRAVPWVVDGFTGGFYKLKNNNGDEILEPRAKIKFIKNPPKPNLFHS
jgi:hypothetical protein